MSGGENVKTLWAKSGILLPLALNPPITLINII